MFDLRDYVCSVCGEVFKARRDDFGLLDEWIYDCPKCGAVHDVDELDEAYYSSEEDW